MTNTRWQRSILIPGLLAIAGCGNEAPSPAAPAAGTATTPRVVQANTPHYSIASTADEAATQRAGLALDALFAAYSGFFQASIPSGAPQRMRVRLYGDRAEFVANNRSRPWAEAYYVDGVCHAYVDLTKANPYHWLLHEAVHQLNREKMGFAKEKWINEGLATYFGSSRYTDGRLSLGEPDLDAYPLWWLDRWELAGDWTTDVQRRRVIPLRTLITGRGEPSLDAAVNAYYLGWWSLTHFLLTHDDGRYTAGYRHLIEHGGSLEAFERLIGPVERVEAEWYAHFQGLVAGAKQREAAQAAPADVTAESAR